MKNTLQLRSLFVFVLLVGVLGYASAQLSNARPYDQTGVNVFEPAKELNTTFDKAFVRIGGSFTQQYQALDHGNKADVKFAADGVTDLNKLYDLGNGFNTATANLNLNFQLEDGILVCLENYMSSRHHNEFWVKGGYIQVDKLPMFNNPEWYSKYVRVKIGHMEVNYGDQHFRRTDNGNAIANPFVGNYIMDAFATEIGGEVYLFPVSNVVAMAGVTNGLIKGDVSNTVRKPSYYAKLAYDKQLNDKTRFRISASTYMNAESGRNTLYGGDRTGSRFYFAMEPAFIVPRGTTVPTATTADVNAFSGRINPGFSTNVTSWQVSPFIKFSGLEVFATYEQSQGYASADPKKGGAATPEKRTVNQLAVEGIYRFLPREQVYIGARYNSVTGAMNARITDANSNPLDLTVTRMEIVGGWYPTPNMLIKASYVNQEYKDFPSSQLFSEGYFKGIMLEAAVGF